MSQHFFQKVRNDSNSKELLIIKVKSKDSAQEIETYCEEPFGHVQKAKRTDKR